MVILHFRSMRAEQRSVKWCLETMVALLLWQIQRCVPLINLISKIKMLSWNILI
ncbi:MAG: hypothetical protein ACTSWN_04585 [Promethearchaeota archaeon]